MVVVVPALLVNNYNESGGVGDGAVVQLLSEADPVRLAGQHLAVGEVETLDIAKNPRVILETICWGSRHKIISSTELK